jgi:hypothetical protein
MSEYINLKLTKVTMGRRPKSSEEVVDEPMWVVIHLCMAAILGILLKLAKMLCLSYYFLCFLFNKIGEQEGGKVLPGSGQGVWSGEVSQNNVYTCKYKNDKIKKRKEKLVRLD